MNPVKDETKCDCMRLRQSTKCAASCEQHVALRARLQKVDCDE